jgi:hypothetical protein
VANGTPYLDTLEPTWLTRQHEHERLVTTTTRRHRPPPEITIDGNAEDATTSSITQVNIQTDTSIGSVDKAREGSKFNDDMEIDQGPSSSQEHNLNPVQGNESPSQIILDGLVSTPGGVSSGVYTDLETQKWAAPQCPECELEPTQDL